MEWKEGGVLFIVKKDRQLRKTRSQMREVGEGEEVE